MINSCDCVEDGYCQRYRREMRGRFREICRGVNVDLGTAAAFREQWARETILAAPPALIPAAGPRIPLILRTDQMPGDAVAMTAAVYSLHRAHPGKYLTAVESRWPEVFEHNPDVANNLLSGGVEEAFDFAQAAELHMHYPAIHQCNERGIHFMQGWCEFLGAALGVPVPLLTDRPRLYFDTPNPPTEDFWIVCSGGKRNFTTKLWGHRNYQDVVSILQGAVRFIQVGALTDDHPRLRGVGNAVGQTTLRDLFYLVRRSRGVLCGISLLMHVAAALEKPAIVIAGGREPVQWNAYPKQHYLHAVGVLPCRSVLGHSGHACWRSRTVPLGDGSFYDRDTCERPVAGADGSTPECMAMIRPAQVAELIMRYNRK